MAKLVAATTAPYVQAIQNAFSAGASTNVELNVEQIKILRDYMNMNSPLAAYTSGIEVSNSGAGSLEILLDGDANAFVDKDFLGDGSFKGVKQRKLLLSWNKPVAKSEAMTKFDLKKGAVNTLMHRMDKSAKLFVQKSIREALALIATPIKTGAALPSSGSVVENAQAARKVVIEKATAFLKETQYTRDLVTLTLSPELFDTLADGGLVGNRAAETFAGGQYSIGTLGGYKVQSGEVFMPVGVDFIIGTNNSMVHSVDAVAVNAGRLGISSDEGTYIEMADIAAIPAQGFLKADGSYDTTNPLVRAYVFGA